MRILRPFCSGICARFFTLFIVVGKHTWKYTCLGEVSNKTIDPQLCGQAIIKVLSDGQSQSRMEDVEAKIVNS